jgi:hypothetical protein
MSNVKTMLAMLALGTTVAFTGPAFAEKMKGLPPVGTVLSGKSIAL